MRIGNLPPAEAQGGRKGYTLRSLALQCDDMTYQKPIIRPLEMPVAVSCCSDSCQPMPQPTPPDAGGIVVGLVWNTVNGLGPLIGRATDLAWGP